MEERELSKLEIVLINHISDLVADARRIEEMKESNYSRFRIVHDEEKEDMLFELLNELCACYNGDVWIDHLPTYREANKLSKEHYAKYVKEVQ